MARRRPQPAWGDVTDLTHDGRGVASADGKRVFIHDTLPGEHVEYQIVKRRRSYDEALPLTIENPSAQRVSPRCDVFGRCGGCSLQHVEHDTQLELKQRQLRENLHRIGRLGDIELAAPIVGPAWGYRRRARLGVKNVYAKGRVLVGFRERMKPFIVDMGRCDVLTPALTDLPTELADLIETLDASTRIPQVEVSAADNQIALVFRFLDAPSAADLDRLAGFQATKPYTVWLQTGGPDTIVPLAAFQADVADPGLLNYRFDRHDVSLSFRPADFVQINAAVNAALVDHAIDALALDASHTVLDLFCGIGNFTLPIARQVEAVYGVEGSTELTDRASKNAIANGITNAFFSAQDLDQISGHESWLQSGFSRVLLDPARAGAANLMPFLGKYRPDRVVYVSCHPGTLARDLGVLVNDFGFRLVEARIADMFPHTAHVESVAVLDGPR
ncbi:MAG: 23S rRNA (uracil(1939)-C(5))-methyltransferase RlmD [Pseudomonadota bacterium]